MIIYISLEIITILIHYASESNNTRSKLRFRISKIIWSHHSTKWKSNESIINLRYSQADIQVAKITDQKIDNLWLETGCEPTTDIAFMPAMQMAWCTTSKSNTSVRDTDSQKYEGGRVVAVLSFDRCVSVLPNESGLNETNIDCPWMPTYRYPWIVKTQSCRLYASLWRVDRPLMWRTIKFPNDWFHR